MMSLLFGDCADGFHKFERAHKIGEVVTLLDMVLFNDFPSAHLARQIGEFFAFEWWNSAFARYARFVRKLSHALFAGPSEL